MAFRVRRVQEAVVYALVAAHNKRQEESVDSEFHADVTSLTNTDNYRAPTVAADLITLADADSEASAIALANQAKQKINVHFADDYAHNTAASAAVATADATAEASAITLANALKAAYNTHLSAANVHFNNDGTNDVEATNASDAASLYTLLNELKDDFNAHIISGPAGAMLRLVDP